MNILMDAEPQVAPDKIAVETEKVVSSANNQTAQSISFRQCLGSARRPLKVRPRNSGCSWNSVLSKIQANSPTTTEALIQVPQSQNNQSQNNQGENKSFERREFPRHTSEAIVLAFSKDEQSLSGAGDHPGAKGYAINVSQNGLSFASRSEFPLRDELQLHVEDQRVKFALDVTASVVRATPLDDEFWRIDCKLIAPLTDQQVALLKEHVPSCYAG
ncbi:PilZ domain-containing protein [uncultured Gimesia sp.]|uniref:PilZ domain-containing protein n=1 Tax=uncultured Gimesia sp. TaxID=1678688 RepID=UPI0030DA969C|tara:strand:- start:145658 stop:146305 length:648 start_codon:yes stop_codon:yes gene_type:complete